MDLIDLYEMLLQHGLERNEKTANLARAIWMAFKESPSQLASPISAPKEPLKVIDGGKSAQPPVKNGHYVSETAKDAIRREWRAGGVSKDALAKSYGLGWGTVDKIVEGIKPRKSK